MSRALSTLAYPFHGPHRGDALVATWPLLLAHGLVPVVTLVPVAGILLRVLAWSGRGIDDPPSVLEDTTGLLRESLGAAVVGLAYVGPPLAYLLAVLQVVSGTDAVDPGSLLVLAAATVGGIAILVATYLLPVALVGYASDGSLRAAFDRGRLRRGARSGRYLLSWLAGVVVLDVGALAAAWLAGASAVRVVLAALVAAYALLIATRLIGLELVHSGVVPTEASGRPKTLIN